MKRFSKTNVFTYIMFFLSLIVLVSTILYAISVNPTEPDPSVCTETSQTTQSESSNQTTTDGSPSPVVSGNQSQSSYPNTTPTPAQPQSNTSQDNENPTEPSLVDQLLAPIRKLLGGE